MRRNGKSQKNRIWILAVLVLLTILSAAGVRSAFPTALALEQAARCGLEEHVHSEACYVGDVLVCREKMHTHTENCYLVLLADNDINELLTRIDTAEDNSLESLISVTVLRATAAAQPNTNGTYKGPVAPASPSPSASPTVTPSLAPTISPSVSPSLSPSADPTAAPTVSPSQTVVTNQPLSVAQTAQPITNEQIAALNAAADTGETGVVLNEYLITPVLTESASEGQLLNTLLSGSPGSGGLSTLAVGGNPSAGTRKINFYIRLDGVIKFVSSGDLTSSNPEYYTYGNTVKAYTDYVVTDLSTNNIGGTYYFRYNTSGNTANFNNNASYSNSRVCFGNSNNAQYTILTTRSGRYNNYTYEPVDFYTVTLNYARFAGGTNEIKYVQDGLDSGLSPNTVDYDWYDSETGTTALTAHQITAMLRDVGDAITLYARPRNHTVTYLNANGSLLTSYNSVKHDSTHVVHLVAAYGTVGSGYVWVLNENNSLAYVGGEELTVSEDLTFLAKRLYTVTYIHPDGSETTDKTVWRDSGKLVLLPDLPDGYLWKTGNGTHYSAGTSVPITADTTFTAVEGCMVTYIDADGRVEKVPVSRGAAITVKPLPDGCSGWYADDGTIYYGGETLTVDENITLTARHPLTISYNVNFPDRTTISTSATVTVLGYSGSFAVAAPQGTTVMTPSEMLVVGTRQIENTSKNCVAFFAGWEITVNGETRLVRAGTNLTWEDLVSYADGRSNIEFRGKWNTDTDEIARFFVRLDSTAANYSGSNIDTSSSKYTGEIFTTYIGGDPATNFKIEDETADNSYTADQSIRALLGEKEGTWLYSLPTDESVFAILKQYTSSSLAPENRLRFVDTRGNTVEFVDGDELDSDHYAIRWYVFKHETDGWHIDGRLVKKEGVIHVEKTFAGDAELVEAGKNGFYITATHSDADDSRNVLMKLHLGDSTVTTPGGTTEIIEPYSVSDDGLTYVWHILDVEYNEKWTITEHREARAGASVYTEYSVYDSKGIQSAISRYGTTVSVTGVTYAPDEDDDHILRAEFRNFYLASDSIAIKKEDGKSGQPISGATFELWQQLTDVDGNKSWVQLKFRQDGSHLVFDQEKGTITQIVTGQSGYSEIVIEDFSYDAGPVLVREVGAPAGYVPAPEIVLQQVAGGDKNEAEIITVGGEAYAADEHGEHMYAEYYSDEKVLVVKNYSQATTTVTAKKSWVSPQATWTDSVTVELYANGVLASSLVPSINPIVELKREDGYSYVWYDMPTYINGQPVTWTIREIQVGDEALTVSGSFVNWIDTYNRYETRDADGNLTELTLEVVNDTRRTLLYVEKTDDTGLVALSGANFRLEAVEKAGHGFVNVTGGYSAEFTTDANGWVTFDNLTAGYYRLTETSPPAGFLGMGDPVYLYVDASGKIRQAVIGSGGIEDLADGVFEDGLSRPSDFTIRVTNQLLAVELPDTGGRGTIGYYAAGMALMLLALSVAILPKLRRRGRYRMRD